MVRQMKKILTAIMVAYIPSSLIIAAFIGGDSAFFDTPFVFDVLIILIYTLPILIGMIGVAFCFIRLIESQWHISIYNGMTMLIALSIIILAFAGNEMIYFSLILAALLLMIELIHCVRKKREKNIFSFFKQKSFWVIVLCILLAVTIFAGVYRYLLETENKADPFDGVENTSYAIMYVAGSYYGFQDISVLITCGVGFVCELSFVVAFYEKSAVGVSYTLGNCFHLFAAS